MPSAPSTGLDAGTLQLLALALPIVAVVVMCLGIPQVRDSITRHWRQSTSGVREYFFGPEVDLQADDPGQPEDDAAEGQVQIHRTPVPFGFDLSMYDEAEDDQDDADPDR